MDFGLVLGGFWGVFWRSFSQLGDTFSNLRELCFFGGSWKDNLLKFTRCGGLEALEEDFGIHFGGYLD